MTRIFLLTVLLFVSIQALSQTISLHGNDGIIFSFFNTYNTQGNYTTRFGNVSYDNNLKLYGSDWGLKFDYKRMLRHQTFIMLGIGYLNFGVNKIENETKNGNLIFRSDGRPINYYPNIVYVLYETTKYHYNNLCFHFGIERQFILSPTLSLLTGIDYLHAYRLSEVYYIPPLNEDYRTEDRGNFGDFVNAHFGVSKQWGKFSLAPSFVLSIYNGWKQDIAFEEDPSKIVSNWFNGVGVSIDISYQIFH